MMRILLGAAVFFLAFANGANDNFMGVATLRRSRYFSFRKATACWLRCFYYLLA